MILSIGNPTILAGCLSTYQTSSCHMDRYCLDCGKTSYIHHIPEWSEASEATNDWTLSV